MVLETLLQTLRDSIQDNVTDPNENRWTRGGDWVFTRAVQTSGKPEYPVARFSQVSGPRGPDGVNSDKRRVETRVQLAVWWDTRNNKDSNGEEQEPYYLLQGLIEDIEKHINDNNATWTQESGVLAVKSVDVNERPEPKATLIRKDLDILITWRTK